MFYTLIKHGFLTNQNARRVLSIISSNRHRLEQAAIGQLGLMIELRNRSESLGTFHYARPTDQRPVRLYPRQNGTTFSDHTGPTKRNGSYRF